MKRIFLVFLLIVFIVPLVSATGVYSFTAPPDKAVWAIDMKMYQQSSANIYITLDDGSEITGTAEYTAGLVPTAGDVAISIGDSGEETFSYAVAFPLNIQIWNGDNTTYARQLKMGFGQGGWWNKVAQTTINPSPIRSYYVIYSGNVEVSEEVIDLDEATANLNADNSGENIITLLIAYSSIAIVVFLSLIFWLKFLFVDNLVLTVVLYFTGSMAYAINTSRDIFAFYKTWFRQQAAMFRFIAEMFSATFQIVSQVGAVIGSAIGGVASFAVGLIKGLL